MSKRHWLFLWSWGETVSDLDLNQYWGSGQTYEEAELDFIESAIRMSTIGFIRKPRFIPLNYSAEAAVEINAQPPMMVSTWGWGVAKMPLDYLINAVASLPDDLRQLVLTASAHAASEDGAL